MLNPNKEFLVTTTGAGSKLGVGWVVGVLLYSRVWGASLFVDGFVVMWYPSTFHQYLHLSRKL